MNVIVKSATGTNRREYKGKWYVEQQAALDVGADFPVVFRVNRPEGEEHPPGTYQLDPSCFVTDQHGNLGLKRVRLIAAQPKGK